MCVCVCLCLCLCLSGGGGRGGYVGGDFRPFQELDPALSHFDVYNITYRETAHPNLIQHPSET